MKTRTATEVYADAVRVLAELQTTLAAGPEPTGQRALLLGRARRHLAYAHEALTQAANTEGPRT